MADRNETTGSRPFKINDKDRAILARLEEDGRIPVATLAKDLEVSAPYVRRRMALLKKEGVLGGARIDHRLALGPFAMDALVAVDLDHRHVDTKSDFFERIVEEKPAVISAIELIDDPDAILYVCGQSLMDIHQTSREIQAEPAVASARMMPIAQKLPSQE